MLPSNFPHKLRFASKNQASKGALLGQWRKILHQPSRAPYAGGAMGNVLKLQEKLMGMLVGPAAELPPIAGEHRLDLHHMRLETGPDPIVNQVHRSHGQLGWIEPGSGIAGVAINGGLRKDLAETLQRADKGGIHGDKGAGMGCLDVALAAFRAEALQRPGLFLGKSDRPICSCLFQPRQPFVFGQ